MSTPGADGGAGHPDEPDDLDALLAAHAVGALEEPERSEVEALLRRSPAAAARSAELEEAAAAWGGAHRAEPPPALRARVMAALDDVEQLPPLAPVVPLATARSRRSPTPGRRGAARPLVLAAAAAAVLLAGGTGWQLLRAEQAQQAQPSREVASGVEQVTGAPDAVTLQPVGAAGPWADTRLVHSPSQERAVLTAEDPLRDAGEQVYVLWAVDETGGVRAAGSFAGGSGAVAQAGVGGAVTLAVTLEPRAGGAAPTTAVLARYQLAA